MDLASVVVGVTPPWEQLLVAVGGGLAGGLVGGALAIVAATRSLDKAAGQAEVAHATERAEARSAALLALAWELEINQEILQRWSEASSERPPILATLARDAAESWFGSLPDTPRLAIHQAQLATARYNDVSGYQRDFLTQHMAATMGSGTGNPVQDSMVSAQFAGEFGRESAVKQAAGEAIGAIGAARNTLRKELALAPE